ncbi:MAG: hypothetical protein DRQ13_04850 [Ignavibacteriae bacterium]|nr:MAG: hypothetical protein DRQ13_04850 [Ignavibacteriota bacterium]
MKRVLKPFTNEDIVVCEFHLTKTISYKQMNKRCNLLLTLLIFLFCCVLELYAQEQTPPGFTIGTFVGGAGDQNIYTSFDSSGMNTLVHYAHTVTKPYLSDYSVIARNDSNQSQWISHYATSLYSKWESEENQTNSATVGVKHKFGTDTTWQSVQCWSTLGLSSRKDSLLYGPHYRQEKEYQRWLYNSGSSWRDIFYTARYRMALDYDPALVDTTEEACRITARVRHAVWINGVYADSVANDTLGVPITLKVADFPSDGSFEDFPIERYTYLPDYPEQFIDGKLEIPSDDDITYTDSDGENGIEFLVEWLLDDTLCTLYIDYVEVYDNYGWNDFMTGDSLQTAQTIKKITDYAESYSNWSNIKYWWSQDEPFSIDAYTPMRVVDSLVRSVGGAPLITEFYPNYRVLVNGDSQLVRYYNMVEPEKLMIDFYPFSHEFYPIRVVDLDTMRNILQIAHSLQPGFWYVGQGFGERDADSNWCSWRRPDSSELKATLMLALAHGVKGLMFWNYESYEVNRCSEGSYYDCIVGKAPTYTPSELWYLINDNFVPRLKGKLGNTLLSLNYTGNYIHMECLNCPSQDNNTYDYLTINHYGTNYFWHAGLFEHKDYADNKYFLLANLRTNTSVESRLVVSNNTDYKNVSFVDIEGGSGSIDTTIAYDSSLTYYETMPAGEGRLYRVSPVVKYGGRLIYDEEISSITTLYSEMTIENGAELSISANYTCNANIIVKDGKITRSGSGKLIFDNGFKLIVEGDAEVSGTAQNKLEIDFDSPMSLNGILVDSLGSLDIKNCLIKNADLGISVKSYYNHIDIDSVYIEDCSDYGISISGPIRR